ncbi:RNA polymerase sigma factor [Achromobacter sp.]|uniref:RNA polymerase sigma factor n=1 Tax=Achromobacter sp. TaxID=134375 RepID=UPI0028AD8DD5|nr:sigma-70 family RNA polymerase sigma factor [Achromobacter sp.]
MSQFWKLKSLSFTIAAFPVLWHSGRFRHVSSELDSVRFYKLHRSELVSYADSFVRDRASAEDIVQDAWERVQAVEQGRSLAQPLGYFYRTVRNLALDWLRARKRDCAEADSDPMALAATLQDRSPSPEATVSARKDMHLVLESLEELPERSRLALTLHTVDGLKLREVAEQLGLSVTFTHQLIAEAKLHCIQRLSRRL